MSMVEITDWVITNKLKLEFTDRYDDSVKENSVIEANYSKGDSVEQGSTIKVVISKGNLVMRDFKSLDEFKEWANKYGISYREEHEFNDDVSQGDVISYSYKKGDTIKNGDTIVVKISDGKECKVPNLIGMSKKEVISKLESLNLNYNFVYQSSNKYSKDKVIKQSISAGSKVSSGTTITVTLSNGKKEESNSNSSKPTKPDNSGDVSDSDNNVPSPPPEPVCNSCYIRPGELKSIILNNSGSFNGAASAVRNFIIGRCSGVNVIINDDGGTSGFNPGSYVSGWEGGNFNSCDTITITLAK